MKYAFNPVKNNCLRRLKLAIKNGQRTGTLQKEMAKLGFSCFWISSADTFYKYLVKLSTKRRRAVFRVARAAIKKNDLVNPHSFYYKSDFRDIQFVAASLVADAKRYLHQYITNERRLTFDEIRDIVDQVEKERPTKNEK